ncbi:hypothetical protein [Promicromonospora soli]
MTQAELATAVNTYVRATTGRAALLSADAIRRYERGIVRWPSEVYRRALRRVLEADTDAELGFAPTPRGASEAASEIGPEPLPVPDDGDVRGMSAVTVPDLVRQIRDLATPATVTGADLASLRAQADHFNAWGYAHGGAALRTTIAAQAAHAVELLRTDCPPRLRDGLFAAVGQLGVAAGALLFDAHRHALARRMLDLATNCAVECDDWHLRAKALSWRARQAVWVGTAEQGRTYAELGLVRADRLTATEQAMLLTALARAHAVAGDVQATLRAVGAADEAFSNADPASDPPWMTYYDEAQHLGDTGHALFDLAARGDHVAEATRRLAQAVAGHTDQYVRSRAFSGYKLATLTLTVGDVDHATKIAQQAVVDATEVASLRLRRTAAELITAAREHPGNGTDVLLDMLTKDGTPG